MTVLSSLPRMPRFRVFDAAVSGYQFLLQNWKYLAIIGIVPLLADLLTVAFLRDFISGDAGIFQRFLAELPVTVLSGWFMFLAFRLAVLGERIDRLPRDVSFLLDRARLMRASVLVWVLFNMALVPLTAAFYWAATKSHTALQEAHLAQTAGKAAEIPPATGPETLAMMILLAAFFWGLRLGLLHFVVAVGYPVKAYIKTARGVSLSFRLLGLGALCVFPAMVLYKVIMSPFLPPTAELGEMGGAAKAVFIGTTLLLSWILTAVMTGAAADALRQMLGGREHR